MDALPSFLEWQQTHFPRATTVVAGWGGEGCRFPIRFLEALPSSIRVRVFGTNVGKGCIINRCVQEFCDPQKHSIVLCSDGDIVFDVDSPLSGIPDMLVRYHDKFRYIALQQNGDCRHDPSFRQSGADIVAVNEYRGIAGGCFSLDLSTWMQTGGFPEIPGYGPEDVLFLKRLKDIGASTCILNAIQVFHPPGGDLAAKSQKSHEIMRHQINTC